MPAAPQALAANHLPDGFDCGKPALIGWALGRARQAQASGSAKHWVVADGDRVCGYFSLTVGQADTHEAPERLRKGMGNSPIEVVILARLAVSLQDQGKSIGAGLLQVAIRRTVAIADQAGVRVLLTHPIDDQAARLYQRFGFEPSPMREPQWLLLLKVCAQHGCD